MLHCASMRSAILLGVSFCLVAYSREEQMVVAAGYSAAGGAKMQAEAIKTVAIRTVVIKDLKYEPEIATVKVGDTLEWKNQDTVPHTATATGEFDSKGIRPGGTWKYVASQKGTFNYICTLHPNMKGKLIVE